MHRKKDGKPLTYTAVRLWCLLAMHRNLKTSETEAGVVRMASMLGVSRQMAQKAANELHEEGFLFYKPRGRGQDGHYTPARFTLAVSGRRVQGVGLTMETPVSEAGADHGNHHGNSSFNEREGKDSKEPPRGGTENENGTAEAEQQPSNDELVAYLAMNLDPADVPLTDGRKDRYGKEIKEFRAKRPKVPVAVITRTLDWIIKRWLDDNHYKLTFEMAYGDVVSGRARDNASAARNGASAISGPEAAARRSAGYEELFEGGELASRDVKAELAAWRAENPSFDDEEPR